MLALVRTFQDIWQWRYLVKALTIYTIKKDNRNTIVGNLWHLLNPLLTMCIFLFVFKVIFRGRQPNYIIFFFCGSIFFRMWTTALSDGTEVLWQNGPLIKSSHFPRIIIVLPLTFINLYNVVLESLVLVVLMVIFRVTPGWQLILYVPLAVTTSIGTTGVCLFMSCLGPRFRDLHNIMLHVNRVVFYFAPVMYPITFVPERFRNYYRLNPMTCAVEFSRDIVLRAQTPLLLFMLYYLVICVLIFLGGLAFFIRQQRRVVKYL